MVYTIRQAWHLLNRTDSNTILQEGRHTAILQSTMLRGLDRYTSYDFHQR